MAIYKVRIAVTKVSTYEVEIEAENPDAANDAAEDKIYAGYLDEVEPTDEVTNDIDIDINTEML